MPDDPHLRLREERAVRVEAARRLIDLPRIRAAQWSRWPAELAEECWVDLPTLQARLDHLTTTERAAIEAALDPTN